MVTIGLSWMLIWLYWTVNDDASCIVNMDNWMIIMMFPCIVNMDNWILMRKLIAMVIVDQLNIDDKATLHYWSCKVTVKCGNKLEWQG